MDMRVGLWRKLSAEELMLLNCGVGENSWESLGLQGDPTSPSITTWQVDGETMETVTDCIFMGSKITAGSDCSHEIKIYLLLGRKAMTNLDSILKSRDTTLPTKVHLVMASNGFFQWSCIDVRVGLWRKLSAKELMLLNCSVEEDSCESLKL